MQNPTAASLQDRIAALPARERALLRLAFEAEQGIPEPVAIVGIGCRFPGGVQGPESFLEFLDAGRSAVGPPGADRPSLDDAPLPEGLAGGYLNDIAAFDPAAFQISPREAAQMDPQQRLLLEVAQESLEDAGLLADELAGQAVGVFVGIAASEYGYSQLRETERVDPYTHTGNALSITANRISYCFDFRGPSMAVDTACSSSLVALHLAVESIRRGESSLCLAGGANLLLTPSVFHGFGQLGVLSARGRCAAFDAEADGIVRGEGAGLVALKSYELALRDEDRVYAVIRGSAVEQDGRSFGLTAPNPRAQETVIRKACAAARIQPGQVQYVETHGTGTPLGDPVEAMALGRVIGSERAGGGPCVIGSVKSNLGHLETAAGIAGVIKTALMIRHRRLLPSLNFQRPNPRIPFEELNLKVQTRAEDWPARPGPARAGVSSFGFGGTNAHMILEEAVAPDSSPESDGTGQATKTGKPYLLPLSARGPEALREYARAWIHFLERDSGAAKIQDLVRTSTLHRSHEGARIALMGSDREEFRAGLEAFVNHEPAPGLVSDANPGERGSGRTIFVFPGQGPKWWPLSPSLLELPEAGRVFRAAASELEALTGVDLVQEVFGGQGSALHDSAILQPAFFALQAALTTHWKWLGIHPAAVLGHSMGEIAAAHAAGALDLATGVRVAHWRGRLIREHGRPGKMALVECTPERAREEMTSFAEVYLAAVNGPHTVVLSGLESDLRTLIAKLEADGIFCRILESVDFASHCPFMEPVRDPLRRALADHTAGRAQLPFYSTVNLSERKPDFDGEYWTANLVSPVGFAGATSAALKDGHDTFLEIGPHPVLGASLRSCFAEAGSTAVALSSLHTERPPAESLLESLGQYYVRGGNPDWSRIAPDGERTGLPVRPLQRRDYWMGQLLDEANETTDDIESDPEREEVVADLYDAFAERTADAATIAATDAFLTFGPLESVDPRFSWVRAFALPDQDEYSRRRLRSVQSELRSLLFRQVNLSAVRRVLDFGCGYGSDLARLAAQYDHLQLDGFTLSQRQAEVAREKARIVEAADRVRIFRRDSSRNEFPARYDLAFGFEVAGHVADKDALFANLSRHLNPGGYLLLADFVAHTMGTLNFDEISSYTSTIDDWSALLGRHGLRLVENVDISPEIANFLHDENFDVTVQELEARRTLPEVLRAFLHSYANLGRAFRRGMLSYVLFTIQKDPLSPENRLTRTARDLLESPRTYADVAAEVSEPSLAEIQLWLYRLAWRPAAAIEGGPRSASKANEADSFTIVHGKGHGDLAAELRTLLQQRGRNASLLDASGAGEELPDTENLILVPGIATNDEADAEHFAREIEFCSRVLRWLQDGTASARAGRLFVVTAGVQETDSKPTADAPPKRPVGAALWGLGRVLLEEASDRAGRLIDLDGWSEPETRTAAQTLVAEITGQSEEAQIVLTPEARLVPRLIRAPAALRPAAESTHLVREDAAYLITGASGDLGREVAAWFLDRGARHLLLVSRSGEIHEKLHKQADEIGARLRVCAVDVTDFSALEAAVREAESDGAPIRGVVHAAGLTADDLLKDMPVEALERVIAPKLLGAFHLHRLFADVGRLDFFTLFSSAGALLGRPGQGNYAAANSCLDAFARYRRRLGLPGTSINWGAWTGLGMATEAGGKSMTAHLERLGISGIDTRTGLGIFEAALQAQRVPDNLAVFKLDPEKLREFHPAARDNPLYAELFRTPSRETKRSGATGQTLARIQTAPPDQREDLVAAFLRSRLARILRAREESLDAEQPLRSLGIDSLMAVELKNMIEGEFALPLDVREFVKGGTIASLSRTIAEKFSDAAEPAASPRPAPTTTAEPRKLPLTPPQGWFFEHDLRAVHHWNSAILIETPPDTRAELLEGATRAIMAAHEIYSYRYRIVSGAVEQWAGVKSSHRESVFTRLDYFSVSADEFASRLQTEAGRFHRDLNIETGPLLHVVFFDRGAAASGRLLLVFHHLCSDGFSVPLFAEELAERYRALRDHRDFHVVPGPTYEDFVRVMQARADSAETLDTLSFWTGAPYTEEIPLLPRDFPQGELIDGDQRSLFLYLDPSVSQTILYDTTRALGVDGQTLFLAAVQRTLAAWSGEDRLRLELETHGRERDGLDLSRTHGWCNIMFPLALSGGALPDPLATLRKTRERLQATPGNGESFGLLRFMCGDPAVRDRLAGLPRPEAKVMYYGQFYDQIHARSAEFKLAAEPAGISWAAENRTKYMLYFYCWIFDGRLKLELLYSPNRHREDTARKLLDAVARELGSLRV